MVFYAEKLVYKNFYYYNCKSSSVRNQVGMKIALIGYGRMGHMIEEIAVSRGHEIVCAVDVDNPEAFDSEAFRSADVAIEFTMPSSAYANVLKAFGAGLKVVSGTTGWFADHKEEMETLCREAGFDGYLPKPVKGRQLEEELARLLLPVDGDPLP